MPAEYDKIAALMASDPPLMFFRRFGELNAKNIIYYQAELAGLAVELDAIISLDRKSGAGNAKEYPFSVGHLKGTLGNPKEISMQWEKFLEIRRLLKEYNDALIQQSQLLRLRGPDEAELAGFLGWLRDLGGGPDDIHQWDKKNDLVAIHARQDGADTFTRWIYRKAVPWFHERWGYRWKKTPDVEAVAYYPDEPINSFINGLSICISGLLPASSILVLFFVKNVTWRLVVIFIYNLMFAMVLGVMVKARRAELYAASTAFAAVQVALITNSDGKSC